MLIDANLLPAGVNLRADVVVVGAGPAGLTVAQDLSAAGLHVLVAEAGDRHHSRRSDDALRGECVGRAFPLVTSRQRGFGGTSGHWTSETGLRVRPLDADDLAPSAARPGHSWPFGRDDLDAYYPRALEGIGIDSADAPQRWKFEGREVPRSDGGPHLAGFQFARHDVFTDRFADVTASRRIRLVLNATISSLPVVDDGATVACAVATAGGVRFVATTFVLAAGAIENARILLDSPGRTGAGLGNESDNVGRYFMDHLSFDCAILDHDRATRLDLSAFRELDDEAGRKQQAMLWLGEPLMRSEGLLNAAFWITESPVGYHSPGVSAARSLRQAGRSGHRGDVLRHALRTAAGARDVAELAARSATRRGGRQVGLRILAEQAPRRDSRVMLSDERDRTGMRRVKLDWRISEVDLDSIRGHTALMCAMLTDGGQLRVRQVFDPADDGPPVMTNYHHLGSTRMHASPREGVVDANLKVHTVSNLYVAGGSVMPTGGYVNPTLTILALAHRLADRLLADRAPTGASTP
ncbi:MAG: GMC family oxidoreductase [Acidimicrobiia bacterium]|nr:GMC family oxidoreductase [Acidimicrobiia bacterium]